MLQNLFQLILRSSTVWVFLLLEVVCFLLIIQLNERQGKLFFSSANNFTGAIYRRTDEVRDYMRLNDRIEDLEAENARLRSLLDHSIYNISYTPDTVINDTLRQKYVYTPAGVISKTVVGTKNTLTIDKGKEQDIQAHSGVISREGIVGIVRNVGQYHSVVMSVLHTDARISAAIKHRSVHGSLRWDGKDSRYMLLDGIPNYETIEEGDTVITSGFSNMFPEGIPIGAIQRKTISPKKIDLDIRVQLFHDFFDIKNVIVVTNLMQDELSTIEKGLK